MNRTSKRMASVIGALLLGALALAGLAGCGSDEKTGGGPLSQSEKQYIKNMESHQKSIQKLDAQLTAGVLRTKQQYPEGGLPTEVMDATQGVLDSRRKLIRFWDKVDCPSERFGKLCGLWSDTLNAQYRWDDSVIAFINKPYTDASFKAVIAAGHKQTKLWGDCQDEIKQLQREATGK